MYNLLMITSLILQLSRGIWFIEPSAAEAYKPIVQAILRGEKIDLTALLPKSQTEKEYRDEEMKKNFMQFVCISNSAVSTWGDISKAPKGSVAVTPLKGVVMKNNYCGAPGTKTLTNWMQEADQNSNIIGHLLHVDSPGGSADGTMDFSESIKSLNKPVVCFSDGMMASAAYWAGSGCKHIMASNTLNQIGSIGTYLTLTDWSGADAQDGIKEVDVYATKSTEKNKEYRDAMEFIQSDGKAGSLDPIKKRIDVFNEAFLNGVSKNRYGKSLDKENTLKGQLHFTNEALQYGLIDSVGTFSDAINKVIQLTKN